MSASDEEASVVLVPVEVAEVTVVVDNFFDALLSDDAVARRPELDYGQFEPDRAKLRAEHGQSLLLTVEREGARSTVLYDAGLGRDTALHNLDVLQVDVPDLRAVVLSHGHVDHHGGLEGSLRRLGARRLPFIIHPDAWRDRKAVFPSGRELHLPPPSRNDLEREGLVVTDERRPSLLLDGSVLVTGQVRRVTPFERGLPNSQGCFDGEWRPDPLIHDDQAVVVHVRGHGLVVLSGCSHAGAINVLRAAQRLTGVAEVLAFVGGMHLSGPLFERIIPETLDALEAIRPRWLVPGHCTGWRATHEIARRLPDAFVPTSVGTRLRFA